MNPSRPKLAAVAVLCLATASCEGTPIPTEGGLHKEHERVAVAQAFYASPITGHALAWNGQGDLPNAGVGLQNYWFLEDRLAIGAGLNLVLFDLPGDRVPGGEAEGRIRYFFAELDHMSFFADLNGGFMYTSKDIPQDGTQGNFTFSFGPGVEYRTESGKSMLLGAEFHHMSNARGRDSSHNPSQNELLVWVGLGVTW